MERMFIMTPTFEKSWKDMGLDEAKLQELQDILLKNPTAGDVIPGLGGARKIRIPLTGRGKSGGGRVIYADVVIKERIYLLLAYSKNVREDMGPEQKQILRKIIEQIKRG